MARQNRNRATDLNLTPLKAHYLLGEVRHALGNASPELVRSALRTCEDRLEKHVRYGLHRARKR